ncbi:kinetochore protein NDC80 homolog [Pundamilia nyererei]|uniref:Kinetochore protein NDC80 n=1 Tax=Pundamilia nyererei TaxID=303518 RepID=A0A9Y3V650_9CICH|nr:PREDICTED: kinetochore protein NDC80 homolog [Pundamilia nyererei]
MERVRLSRVKGSRPSEQSLRVQDSNRMSLMYTTPQSKQPSFGKLNIPKPQSGTSERRTSFFGPRTSGVGMPRNSTMSGFGGTEKIKDARPLHDKSYVQQCIRQLHEFLTEQGYPGTLSSKTLQSPSTKEFVKMFEFIYCQLDPTFEMPNSKVEEEVPALFKTLGYPFVLSKCSMYSVGAPHTWPQALGALMWLIDNVKINWSLSKQELLFSDFNEGENIEEGSEFNKVELKLAEYQKLARKLKLIPISAENACGHDFEIRPFEYGAGSMVQCKTQIQMQLRKLVGDVEEENSQLTNEKLSLEESCEQVNSSITDKTNDLKQLREQIRKLDERLEGEKQELAREEQEWAAEMESVENHRKLLEKKVNYGYDESVQQLKAAQQHNIYAAYYFVPSPLSPVLPLQQKCLEDLHSRVQRICSKAVEEDEAAIQKLQETLKDFMSKAKNV